MCRWVSNLSRFLQHVVGQLGRRLTLENSPKDIDDGSDSESDDGSEAPMSGPGDDEQVAGQPGALSPPYFLLVELQCCRHRCGAS